MVCQYPAKPKTRTNGSLAHLPQGQFPGHFRDPHGREFEPFNCKQPYIRVHRQRRKKHYDAWEPTAARADAQPRRLVSWNQAAAAAWSYVVVSE